MVEFSLPARCWLFACEWGCSGFDYESEREAMDAFLNHNCVRN